MLVSTKAIVITSLKYSEADLIVKCYTEDFGLKSYLLKGVLKSRKGKLRASYFQPLTLIELQANHREKGSLEFLKEVKVYEQYHSIPTDIRKTSIVLFLSEVLKQVIQEEEINIGLYRFLEDSFIWLETQPPQGCFHLLFLVKLTAYLGFSPDVSTIEYPVFNILEGSFQQEDTTTYCYTLSKASLFKKLLTLSYEDLLSFKTSTEERAQTLNLILTYYQIHVQGFKTPKSLDVLKTIFENTKG